MPVTLGCASRSLFIWMPLSFFLFWANPINPNTIRHHYFPLYMQWLCFYAFLLSLAFFRPHLSDPILTRTVISLFFFHFLGSLPFFYALLPLLILVPLFECTRRRKESAENHTCHSLSGLRPNTKDGANRKEHQVNHLFVPIVLYLDPQKEKYSIEIAFCAWI